MESGWSLLFQAGMVGAFILYALARDRRESAERDQRDDGWRGFLNEEREQRKEAMDVGTNGLTSLTDAVSRLVSAMAVHDEAAERRAKEVRAVLRRLIAQATRRAARR